jgi:hypothetical protein
MIGPYETAEQAERDGERLRNGVLRMDLNETCRRAGVELGTFDQEVVDQLSGGKTAAAQAVAGIIARAARVLPMGTYAPVRPMWVQDEKRLWYRYLIVGRIVLDPEGAIETGWRRLEMMRAARGADPMLDLWEKILNAGPDEVLATLVARTEQAIELRRWSPFIELVDQEERLAMLDAFNATHPRGEGEWQMPDDEPADMKAKP